MVVTTLDLKRVKGLGTFFRHCSCVTNLSPLLSVTTKYNYLNEEVDHICIIAFHGMHERTLTTLNVLIRRRIKNDHQHDSQRTKILDKVTFTCCLIHSTEFVDVGLTITLMSAPASSSIFAKFLWPCSTAK